MLDGAVYLRAVLIPVNPWKYPHSAVWTNRRFFSVSFSALLKYIQADPRKSSEHHGILGIDVFSQGTAIPEDKLLAVQQSLISMTPIPGSRTSSIGLTNVSQRISVFYGEGFGLWIENSADSQVRVSVTVPLVEHV